MTNKKLIDEKIVKGLQRMSEEDPDGFSADILKVINRQNAEIGRLTKAIDQRLKYKAMQEELTQWKEEANRWQTMFCQEIDGREEIKVEAYKEFAKKLKEEIRLEDDCDYNCQECCYECSDYVISIDNLLKEMVGEDA